MEQTLTHHWPSLIGEEQRNKHDYPRSVAHCIEETQISEESRRRKRWHNSRGGGLTPGARHRRCLASLPEPHHHELRPLRRSSPDVRIRDLSPQCDAPSSRSGLQQRMAWRRRGLGCGVLGGAAAAYGCVLFGRGGTTAQAVCELGTLEFHGRKFVRKILAFLHKKSGLKPHPRPRLSMD
jgi:hypothetical protein